MTAKTQPDLESAADREVIERVLALMRASGGRATPARRLLLRALIESPAHRTAEEIAAEVQSRAPDVHITTIYRNLEELERLRVVDRTRFGHGPATYHLASAGHGHLSCEACGSVTEVPHDLFADLARTTMARYSFAINPGHFAVTGRCAACQEQQAAPAGPMSTDGNPRRRLSPYGRNSISGSSVSPIQTLAAHDAPQQRRLRGSQASVR